MRRAGQERRGPQYDVFAGSCANRVSNIFSGSAGRTSISREAFCLALPTFIAPKMRRYFFCRNIISAHAGCRLALRWLRCLLPGTAGKLLAVTR